MRKQEVFLIRSGRFLREGQTIYVFLIKQNWDYYTDEYDQSPPDLDQDGFSHYLVYSYSRDLSEAISRSETFLTQEQAEEKAEMLLNDLTWDL